MALSGRAGMSAIWPLSGVKQTSASNYRTIMIYEHLRRQAVAVPLCIHPAGHCPLLMIAMRVVSDNRIEI